MGENVEIEAAVFRRLLEHLDSRKDVQNIELMTLAGFCRNCLSKWYVAAAEERGVTVDYEQRPSQAAVLCSSACCLAGSRSRISRSTLMRLL